MQPPNREYLSFWRYQKKNRKPIWNDVVHLLFNKASTFLDKMLEKRRGCYRGTFLTSRFVSSGYENDFISETASQKNI